jgi:hypothetical protein
MPHLINVHPSDMVWVVEGDTFDNALIFQNGGLAERAARDLAEHYALAGWDTDVIVFLRNGALAGRIRFAQADHLWPASET